MATTENGKTVLSAAGSPPGQGTGRDALCAAHFSLALAVIAGVVIYAIFFH